MSVADHFFFIVDFLLGVFINYWFDVVIVVFFLGIILIVSEGALKISTPKTVATCFVMPSIVRSRHSSRRNLKVRYSFPDCLIAGRL